MLQNLLASFRYGWARRFVEDKDASATVEVALTAPIAFAFLSCLTVLSEGMEVLGKVNLTASTIDNIVSSQSSPLAGSSLNCILGAAAPVMAPWDASPMTVVVSEVQVDTNAGQTATVVWSVPGASGTALAQGQVVTLPSGSSAPLGSFLILTSVSYRFTPVVFSKVNFASFTVSRSVYLPTVSSGTTDGHIDVDSSS